MPRFMKSVLIPVFLAVIFIQADALALCKKMKREARIDCLIEALKNEDLLERREAAEEFRTWPYLCVDRAVPVLIDTIEDTDVEVRRSALRAVKHYRKKADPAKEIVRRALRDPDRLVQLYAQEALYAMAGYPEGSELETTKLSFEKRKLEGEIREYKSAVKYLESSCSGRYMGSSLMTLERMGPKALDVLPLVIRKFDECRDEMVVRARALKTMAAIAPADRVVPYLYKGLEDEKAMVRKAAVETLGRIGSGLPDTVPVLIGALEDKDWKVAIAAIEVLKDIGDKRALEPLQKTADHYRTRIAFQQKKVRKTARKALEKMEGE